MKKQTIYFCILIIFLCSCKKQTTTSPNYTSKIVPGNYIWHGYEDGKYINGNRFHNLINDTFSIIKIDNSKIGFNIYYSFTNYYDTLEYFSTNDSQKTLIFVPTQYLYLFANNGDPSFLFYNYVTGSMTFENYTSDSGSHFFFHTYLQTP